MTRPDFPPIVRLARALSITTQLYQSRMSQLLAPHDLTVAQFGVLNHLSRQGEEGQSVGEIAAAVEVNQPAVTKMVQKFDRLGWLARTGRRLRLSAAGQAALGAVQRDLGPDFGRAFAGWSDEEQGTLTALLERLARHYDANRL